MARGSPRPEQGRGEWLSELYQAQARTVEGYCRRFLNNAEDAADATHEVFLRALSSLDAPPASRQARGWLITVAQNYCLDLVRRRRRMQTVIATLGADATGETGSEAEVLNRQLLHTVLQQLGERERQALYQSAVEERTVTEIAGYLGVSYMAAAQVLHRARKHASAVAAKLAAILGLAAANSMRRRSFLLTFAPSLGAVGAVPLIVVLALATPSSAGGAGVMHGLRPAPQHAAPSRGQGDAVSVNASDMLMADDPAAPNRLHRLLQLVPQSAGSTLTTRLSDVSQAVGQLTGSLPAPQVAAPTPLPSPLPSPLPTPLLSPLPTPGLPRSPETLRT
jgi:RNA polymerase sigma-70 factor, ECF subfamily